MEIEDFDLDKEILEKILFGIVFEYFKDIYDNVYDVIVCMERCYKGLIVFEYIYINNNKECVWLKRRIEMFYKVSLNDN